MNIVTAARAPTAYENAKREHVNRIRARIRRKAWAHFDDGELFPALRELNRFNRVTLAVYWGEKELTPGDWLNAYLEQRAFESRC